MKKIQLLSIFVILFCAEFSVKAQENKASQDMAACRRSINLASDSFHQLKGINMNKIFLNHAYVVVGPQIFQALRASAFFMQEFAHVEYKTSSSVNLPKPWTGLYLRGKNTYLEIFEEFDGRQVGDYGFGFGVEEIDALSTLYPRLKAHVPDLISGNFQQPVESSIAKPTKSDTLFTSFKYILFPKIASKTSAKHVDTFIMEYAPEAFEIKKLPSDSLQADSDISRKRYNSKSWDPQGYFVDIESITIFLEPEVFDNFSQVLNLIFNNENKELLVESSKSAISFKGEDIIIHLQKNDLQKPLRMSLTMTLQKPVPERKVYIFDQAELILETNGKALLSFAPDA